MAAYDLCGGVGSGTGVSIGSGRMIVAGLDTARPRSFATLTKAFSKGVPKYRGLEVGLGSMLEGAVACPQKIVGDCRRL